MVEGVLAPAPHESIFFQKSIFSLVIMVSTIDPAIDAHGRMTFDEISSSNVKQVISKRSPKRHYRVPVPNCHELPKPHPHPKSTTSTKNIRKPSRRLIRPTKTFAGRLPTSNQPVTGRPITHQDEKPSNSRTVQDMDKHETSSAENVRPKLGANEEDLHHYMTSMSKHEEPKEIVVPTILSKSESMISSPTLPKITDKDIQEQHHLLQERLQEAQRILHLSKGESMSFNIEDHLKD